MSICSLSDSLFVGYIYLNDLSDFCTVGMCLRVKVLGVSTILPVEFNKFPKVSMPLFSATAG